MEIVSAGPLPVASVLWRPAQHTFALTVVCRATFQLAPGTAELAAEQDAPNEEDTHWNDDPSRSLSAPSDLAPFKPRADVILVGNAYAPRGEPVRALVARLQVGEIDKSIEVFGERSFNIDGELREGPRFARMPLRWERAAGGLGTSNPVGTNLDAEDALGATVIPNLQPLGLHVERRGQHVPPVGFGPIAPSWPSRRELLGRLAGHWPGPRWMDEPLPAEVEAAYFNAAPRDQLLAVLREDEQIILENLHPDHPRLVTSLPGVRPRATVERRGTRKELALRADTLWIDTARAICTLTWRGRLTLDHPAEPGRVVIELDTSWRRAAQPSSASVLETMGTMAPLQRPPTAPALPFVASTPGTPAAGTPVERPARRDSFVDQPVERPARRASLVDQPAPDLVDAQEDLTATVETMFNARSALPFVPARSAPAHPTPAPQAVIPPPRPSVPAAPALFLPPVSPAPIAPRMETTPWAGSAAPDPGRRHEATAIGLSPLLATDAAPAPNAAAGGVLVASDLAAGADRAARVALDPEEAPAPAPRGRAAPREVVKLVWFDAAALPRIRKHPAFRRLLAELEMRLLAEDEADIAAGPAPAEVRDRRAVLEVLLHGEPIGADGIRQAVEGSIREDGGFEPPLAVVAAELEMPFDELETLKATAAALRPLASSDKRLKETLDLVDPLLASSWLSGSGTVAEGMTAKLREAFAQGKRPVPPDYLSAHADRMLLEQRAYQRRALFDKKWIRSVMRGAVGAIPAYLPEETRDGLPMFRRFRARLLAELDMREDEGETSPWAARVLAVGRVITQGN